MGRMKMKGLEMSLDMRDIVIESMLKVSEAYGNGVEDPIAAYAAKHPSRIKKARAEARKALDSTLTQAQHAESKLRVVESVVGERMQRQQDRADAVSADQKLLDFLKREQVPAAVSRSGCEITMQMMQQFFTQERGKSRPNVPRAKDVNVVAKMRPAFELYCRQLPWVELYSTPL